MLSLTCKTAIKAVIYLASKFESGEKAGIKEIAEYINASEHSVGKMLQTLVKGTCDQQPERANWRVLYNQKTNQSTGFQYCCSHRR